MAIDKITTPAVTDANITTDKVTDNAITLAKMASGTDGNIISYDASGNPVAVATGTSGHVLTSAGAGAPPTFAVASANTPAFSARMNGIQAISHATATKIEVDTELFDTNNAYNTSTYRFTPGVAGKYLVNWNVFLDGGGAANLRVLNAQIYVNGSLLYISGFDSANGYENNGRESLSAVITLDDNDYIEPYFYAFTQNSAAVTIGGGTHTYDSLFAAHRLIGV
jgi:hypothetical protein